MLCNAQKSKPDFGQLEIPISLAQVTPSDTPGHSWRMEKQNTQALKEIDLLSQFSVSKWSLQMAGES